MLVLEVVPQRSRSADDSAFDGYNVTSLTKDSLVLRLREREV